MPIPYLSPSTVFNSKDSMQHSKVSESDSLDLALESLSLSSSAEEKLEASSDTEDLISSSEYDSSESEGDLHPTRMLTPFDVYYAKDDDTLPVPVSAEVPPHFALSSSDQRNPSPEVVMSDSNESASSNYIRSMSWTRRESRLSRAWERKRELVLQEFMNLKERAKPHLLGRSISDCGKAKKNDNLNARFLQRSASTDFSNSDKEASTRHEHHLTDHDFEELKGCIDLGFRFDQNSVTDLCETLPALEICCAIAQNLQDSPSCSYSMSPTKESPPQHSSPLLSRSWSIASAGDNPEEIKERLRHWAQAVACNARLCC